MSRPEYKRLIVQRNGILPKESSGRLNDLPEHITTMWPEMKLKCPNDKHHNIKGSSRKIYCHSCGIWWAR